MIDAFASNASMQAAIMRIVVKHFKESETYKRRQLFVIMCGEAINHSTAMFHAYFMKHMQSLVCDKVISVRMALARVLRSHYVLKLTDSLVGEPELSSVIKTLQRDKSSDIRQLVIAIPVLELSPTLATEDPLTMYGGCIAD